MANNLSTFLLWRLTSPNPSEQYEFSLYPSLTLTPHLDADHPSLLPLCPPTSFPGLFLHHTTRPPLFPVPLPTMLPRPWGEGDWRFRRGDPAFSSHSSPHPPGPLEETQLGARGYRYGAAEGAGTQRQPQVRSAINIQFYTGILMFIFYPFTK